MNNYFHNAFKAEFDLWVSHCLFGSGRGQCQACACVMMIAYSAIQFMCEE